MKRLIIILMLILLLFVSIAHSTVWFTCGSDNDVSRKVSDDVFQSYLENDTTFHKDLKWCPRIDGLHGNVGDWVFSFDGTIKDSIVAVTITTLEIDEHENFIYRSISTAILKINNEGNFGNMDFTEGYMLYKK